jgi:hypothetical protein
VVGPNPDDCSRVQTMIFELNNIASAPKYKVIDDDAAAGNVSRADYIKRTEHVEYDGLRRLIDVHAACKDKWCCEKSPSRYDWMKGAKDFDDYFDHYLAQSHKDFYGSTWDTSYKAAYQAKHP